MSPLLFFFFPLPLSPPGLLGGGRHVDSRNFPAVPFFFPTSRTAFGKKPEGRGTHFPFFSDATRWVQGESGPFFFSFSPFSLQIRKEQAKKNPEKGLGGPFSFFPFFSRGNRGRFSDKKHSFPSFSGLVAGFGRTRLPNPPPLFFPPPQHRTRGRVGGRCRPTIFLLFSPSFQAGKRGGRKGQSMAFTFLFFPPPPLPTEEARRSGNSFFFPFSPPPPPAGVGRRARGEPTSKTGTGAHFLSAPSGGERKVGGNDPFFFLFSPAMIQGDLGGTEAFVGTELI